MLSIGHNVLLYSLFLLEVVILVENLLVLINIDSTIALERRPSGHWKTKINNIDRYSLHH